MASSQATYRGREKCTTCGKLRLQHSVWGTAADCPTRNASEMDSTTSRRAPITRAVAEHKLHLLRVITDANANHDLPGYEQAADELSEILIAYMGEQQGKYGWPRSMALEVIDHAIKHRTTLREAMYACQTG